MVCTPNWNIVITVQLRYIARATHWHYTVHCNWTGIAIQCRRRTGETFCEFYLRRETHYVMGGIRVSRSEHDSQGRRMSSMAGHDFQEANTTFQGWNISFMGRTRVLRVEHEFQRWCMSFKGGTWVSRACIETDLFVWGLQDCKIVEFARSLQTWKAARKARLQDCKTNLE